MKYSSIPLKESIEIVKLDEKKNVILPDKENFSNYLIEDKLYLTQRFSEYDNFLNQKKNNLKLKEEDAKKKFSVNLENLKYISSKTTPGQSVVVKKVKNEEIDTQKLIAIQKGQKQIYEKRLKNKEILLNERFSKLMDKEIEVEDHNPINTVKNEILKATRFKEDILVT